MSRRWLEAQRAEEEYWDSGSTIESESLRIDERYGRFLSTLPVSEGSRILDVGCGPTMLARHISTEERCGIDPLMDSYVGGVDGRLWPSIHLVRAVGEHMPFRAGCFDLVLCRNVLDHVLSPEQVVKEMSRVAGVRSTIVVGVDVYSPFVCSIKKLVERSGIPVLREKFHPHFFTVTSVKDLLSRYQRILAEGKVFSDDIAWDSIRSHLVQDQKRGRNLSFSYRLVASTAAFSRLLFWNVVRLLNSTRSDYYSLEYVVSAGRKQSAL